MKIRINLQKEQQTLRNITIDLEGIYAQKINGDKCPKRRGQSSLEKIGQHDKHASCGKVAVKTNLATLNFVHHTYEAGFPTRTDHRFYRKYQ